MRDAMHPIAAALCAQALGIDEADAAEIHASGDLLPALLATQIIEARAQRRPERPEVAELCELLRADWGGATPFRAAEWLARAEAGALSATRAALDALRRWAELCDDVPLDAQRLGNLFARLARESRGMPSRVEPAGTLHRTKRWRFVRDVGDLGD